MSAGEQPILRVEDLAVEFRKQRSLGDVVTGRRPPGGKGSRWSLV